MNKLINPYKIILAGALVILSSCSQEPVKPETFKQSGRTEQGKSATKADRDKYREGLIALNNHDNAKAQRIFSEFIRNKPGLAGAYTNMALIHSKNSEYDQSLTLINKAIQLNPKQSQAYNLRAQIMLKNGKIHKAKDDYIKAVELNPKYINAQYNLALLYDIYLQEIELAIKHYNIYMSLLKKPDQGTKEWVDHLKGTLKNG
jgi:tetratricopeptide (TPR) repeat protein